MHEVGCPEPASAVELMEWMRSRVALSANNPIRSFVMKPSLSSSVEEGNSDEDRAGSYYESGSFSNEVPARAARQPLQANNVRTVRWKQPVQCLLVQTSGQLEAPQ